MSNELSDELREKFGHLLVKDSRQGKPFSFDIGDGWFGLVYELLDFINRVPVKVGIVLQIKQKFGILCVYNSFDEKEIVGATSYAVNLSGRVCESCGAMRSVGRTTGGYIQTLCLRCVPDEKREGWRRGI